ncbi:MAG: hypothetical protein JWR50_3052 [Mucilaginibacter sp.]|nr:hypothetical protein [Mucilaginibacter sp.]
MRKLCLLFIISVCHCGIQKARAQEAFYIDGYHGGVWGHYPDWNTRYMVETLKKNPDWKINIELEPETWDRAMAVDPAAYAEFKAMFADQSLNGRIEYINPAYAQSYMYNISGESIIRQLSYGMKMIKAHFPEAVFTTYSSEEPCFTSALPQILKSFGFKYASLKNPNTCFGGYTSPHGGGLVNWIGPDGTSIIASPRYNVERLSPKSTWQTIAWDNSAEYIQGALADGITHPVGMTLQDAGWKNGPFIGNGRHGAVKSTYTTWRNYFANIAKGDLARDWKVSQEDINVSLVWGSQVTQQIAQKVRVSENKLVTTEKLMAIAKVYGNGDWPKTDLDSAWRTLLLSQHHDCWIVPYNGKPGNTWADKVTGWTNHTNKICDSLVLRAENILSPGIEKGDFITVYNTTAVDRNEAVAVSLPDKYIGINTVVIDAAGNEMLSETVSSNGVKKIVFKAKVPPIGYQVYQLKQRTLHLVQASYSIKLTNEGYKIETDLYRILLDTLHGGIIKSLIAKKLNNKEFVDQTNARSFNELRGNFYDNGGFRSSADSAVSVEVLQNGPVCFKLAIKGKIAGNDFTQIITLVQGRQRIDVNLKIDWKNNLRIGDGSKPGDYKIDQPAKPFYDDRNKLLAMFPLNLKHQKVYKNAPFDVTESKLKNTFFTRWDSIKNNVILNWVDVTGNNDEYGMALFTDHTTSYAHGTDFPLALDIQYSGMGLWGRNYTINGPTEIQYALIPHAGKWDKAGIWAEGTKWNESLIAVLSNRHPQGISRSLVNVPVGYEVTTINFNGKDMLVRLFNTGNVTTEKITFNCNASSVSLIQLDGSTSGKLVLYKKPGKIYTIVHIPKFGIRTIKLENVNKF